MPGALKIGCSTCCVNIMALEKVEQRRRVGNIVSWISQGNCGWMNGEGGSGQGRQEEVYYSCLPCDLVGAETSVTLTAIFPPTSIKLPLAMRWSST